jgi:surfeit locus 1 family protein
MMPSLSGFKRRFTPNWQMTLLAFVVIAILLRLGFWQLARATEKKAMIQAELTQIKQKPISWTDADTSPKQYQRLKLSGRFLAPVLLMDNQHHDHQFGFSVLSPLLLINNQVVLVDRGWVPGDSLRQTWPIISTPKMPIDIIGTAYYPSDNSLVLGQVLEVISPTLAVVEAFDAKEISHFLQKPIYPFMIRLDKNEAHGYVRAWQVVSMPPSRHYGYALQWFVMAVVVLILFIALNFKKKS